MKVLVISGSRADRGPLTPVAACLGNNWLCVDPTPSRSGFDSAHSCSYVMNIVADALDGIRPDFTVMLGDRFEILGAACAAQLMGVPIVHLSGGDVTIGSQDDSMRHAITKMAHLHFPTHDEAAKRIIAMGEEPWRVHVVGCPGVDNVLAAQLYSKEATITKLGVAAPYMLIAYQPPTLAHDPLWEADQLLQALRHFPHPYVFTTVNADAYGRQIEAKFTRFCLGGRGVLMEMDHELYLSAMKHCLIMVGNSSSGFYEAPSLKVPFVNVGDRQRGRPLPASVYPCSPVTEAIVATMQTAQKAGCPPNTVNPYGDGAAAARIKFVLENLAVDRHTLLTKHWGGGWPSTEYGNECTQTVSGDSTPKKNSLGLFAGPSPSLGRH